MDMGKIVPYCVRYHLEFGLTERESIIWKGTPFTHKRQLIRKI